MNTQNPPGTKWWLESSFCRSTRQIKQLINTNYGDKRKTTWQSTINAKRDCFRYDSSLHNGVFYGNAGLSQWLYKLASLGRRICWSIIFILMSSHCLQDWRCPDGHTEMVCLFVCFSHSISIILFLGELTNRSVVVNFRLKRSCPYLWLLLDQFHM